MRRTGVRRAFAILWMTIFAGCTTAGSYPYRMDPPSSDGPIIKAIVDWGRDVRRRAFAMYAKSNDAKLSVDVALHNTWHKVHAIHEQMIEDGYAPVYAKTFLEEAGKSVRYSTLEKLLSQ